MSICSENFIEQTAKDYDVDVLLVKGIFENSSNLLDFHSKMEDALENNRLVFRGEN